MSVSVARVRVWLLAGAGLLVLVIAAFLGVARYRATRFIKDLPRKLGVNIQQETTGFTYSQSDGPNGKTIYTIHAAKAVQRKDGKVNLHDVGIVLYGKGQENARRADRIYGNEFEYDQNTEVITAIGEVHIDLQAPAPADASARSAYAGGRDLKTGEVGDERIIHITTSDLVFIQKLATAATNQDVEFTYSGLTGHAHGAEFNSDTGGAVLESAVTVNGMKGGKPAFLTAARAELDRQKQQVLLENAVYTVLVDRSRRRVAKSDHVTGFLRPDGSVERAVGVGNVSLMDEDGATITAARGEAQLNEKGQPQTAALSGGVHYVSDEPQRQARGGADEGNADFDKDGHVQHVLLTGSVHLKERLQVELGSGQTTGRQAWSERELSGKALDLMMEPGTDRQILLKNAKATGGAQITVTHPPAAAVKGDVQGLVTSVLTGDSLSADFSIQDGVSHVRSVHGAGHTNVRRVSDTGATGTSSGDRLEAEFHAAGGGSPRTEKSGKPDHSAGKSGSSKPGTDEITTAIQEGHVVMTNLPAAKPGTNVAAEEQRGIADRVVYDDAADTVTLTGGVRVSQSDSVVWANRMLMERETGDAVADGEVRANYLQAENAEGKGNKATEPVHVLAARGQFKHDAQVAKFYGAEGKMARLWQGASQVEAPVLEFEQERHRMLAHGAGKEAGMVVHSVFGNAEPGGPNTTKASQGSRKAVRVESHELAYDDVARRGDFSGGILVEDQDGTMRAQQAMVYLKPVDSSNAAAGKTKVLVGADSFMGGSVERVVATGQIEILQPGRKVTGQQVVYTAADGMYVITGTPGTLPKMIDEAQGTVTGASLRFHAGDNSVVISNEPDRLAGQKVRSETRVK